MLWNSILKINASRLTDTVEHGENLAVADPPFFYLLPQQYVSNLALQKSKVNMLGCDRSVQQ